RRHRGSIVSGRDEGAARAGADQRRRRPQDRDVSGEARLGVARYAGLRRGSSRTALAVDGRALRRDAEAVARPHQVGVAGGRNCLRTFLMNVCVHLPWLVSYSMISRTSLPFVSFETVLAACTSFAS